MFQLEALREKTRDASLLVVAAVMAVSGAAPFILQGQANAATLTARKVTITTSQEGATAVGYDFDFTTVTSSAIRGLIFQFCSTPLGTCTLPGDTPGNEATDDNVELDAAAATVSSGGWTGTSGTNFTTEVTADTGQCTSADGGSQVANMYCVTRAEGTVETPGAKSFVVSGVTNPMIPTGNNEEVYVRVYTYSQADFASGNLLDEGTVAAAIVNQLQVTGRVQERLVFCVYALDDTAASTAAGSGAGVLPTNCAADEANDPILGSNVDIGVITESAIARAPVDDNPPADLGNDTIGAAQVNTNASGGVSVTYYATTAGAVNEDRAFRATAADVCNVSGTSLVDQCFISASTAGETFVVDGTDQERFGMNIVCVVNSNTNTAGTTSNLGTGNVGAGTGNTFNTAYANGDTTRTQLEDTAGDDCENNAGETDVYAWNDTGTAEPLIGSSTVVDDELIKLRFAALAQATTPTGTYTVNSTFIATPTF